MMCMLRTVGGRRMRDLHVCNTLRSGARSYESFHHISNERWESGKLETSLTAFHVDTCTPEVQVFAARRSRQEATFF